jgi:hypothetical protein
MYRLESDFTVLRRVMTESFTRTYRYFFVDSFDSFDS